MVLVLGPEFRIPIKILKYQGDLYGLVWCLCESGSYRVSQLLGSLFTWVLNLANPDVRPLTLTPSTIWLEYGAALGLLDGCPIS